MTTTDNYKIKSLEMKIERQQRMLAEKDAKISELKEKLRDSELKTKELERKLELEEAKGANATNVAWITVAGTIVTTLIEVLFQLFK